MTSYSLGALIFGFATLASGQTNVTFEVASIKPSPPLSLEAARAGRVFVGLRVEGSRVEYGRIALKDLICRAYRLRSFQVSGPDWTSGALFDIIAKLPDGSSIDVVPEMLQALLADRFGLTVRNSAKEFSVYSLVVGKDGPKLISRPKDYTRPERSEVGPMTMAALAEVLSPGLDRPVIDNTNLAGEYMISGTDLTRGFVQLRANARARPATGEISNESIDSISPDIFAVIQGLGLRLESRKVSLPVLMIDHIDRNPSEN